jgi:hypothetical protein
MAITLKRQITDDEKKRIIEIHGRRCFATGHVISEDDPIHFDHIKAFADGGLSEIDNIAPMCELHNKQKGRLPLYDFKIRLKIDGFFRTGDTLTLKNELIFLKQSNEIEEFGNPISIIEKNDGQIELEINNSKRTFTLYKCPITYWEYFYTTIPISVLDSDDDEENEIGLQPRYLIFDKVFNLFRHFQRHPVLQPSICRIHKNKILVFDGQHKIAALLWGGRKNFEVKVYLNPDPNLLNTTNISAHDKFAQTRFFSTIMVAKLGSQFGKEFEEYKNIEDGTTKSEAGFLNHLKEKEQLSQGEINKRFRSFLYHSVLDDEHNKIARLVSKGNRGTSEKPITMDMLQKSLFSVFLFSQAVNDDMTSSTYKREQEIDNIIKCFNILDEEVLHNWDGGRPNTDPTQNKLNRMFRSKSIMSWTEILHGAICAELKLHDSEDRLMPFYRILTDDKFNNIRFIIRRLVNWSVWDSPINSEIDRILADNKSIVKTFLKDKGLTTGYLMGAPE